jgi:hypothetical protein
MKQLDRVVIFVSLAMAFAFAGLVPLGTWQDDFLYLHGYQLRGFGFLLERLQHWSPRPLSESLIYLYALAVQHANAPLIGGFIGLFWLVLAGAMLLPPLLGRRGLLPATVMLAMFLLGHPVTEFFYWPDGVAAYLPTLAAAGLLLALDWGGWSESWPGHCWTVAALTIAAASSEVGAVFSIIYIVLLLVSCQLTSEPRRFGLALPLLTSLGVLCLQFNGRVAQASEVIGNAAIAHHLWPTLLATAKDLPAELIRDDTLRHKYVGLAAGLLTKLFLFAGLYWSLSARPAAVARSLQGRRLILVLAALATASLTMAASWYNFGTRCCERHDTLQQAYVLIAIGALSTMLAARWPSRRHRLAAPALLLALAIPAATAIPRLVAEYRDYTLITRVRAETWRSGRAPGKSMTLTQTTPNLTGNLLIPPGNYRRSADPAADQRAQWMLIFFDKQSLTVTPAINAKPRNKAKND